MMTSSDKKGKPKLEEYYFVASLGAGSYGHVFKAVKKRTEELSKKEFFAVKCVEKGKLSGTAAENLISEISLLKKLKHENIVVMNDFRWDQTFIYIIMEYCGGGDLSHFIKQRRALPETLIQNFLAQIAAGIEYLYENQVAHMDLKPQNILLTQTAPISSVRLKIADFGFSQHLGDGERLSDGTLRGSLLYMAPEVIQGKSYDARVDLWSVGIILYECLFGKAPYASNTVKELLLKWQTSQEIQIPPDSFMNRTGATVSESCCDLLRGLLHWDPDKRISFKSFFQHPFIVNTPGSLAPCSSAVWEAGRAKIEEAVSKEKQGKTSEALGCYEEGILLLRDAISSQDDQLDASGTETLRKRIRTYEAHAEKLSACLSRDRGSSELSHLIEMCLSTPPLKSALDIGKSAEEYDQGAEFSCALETYTKCLGLLIPLIEREPTGERKTQLKVQAHRWMSRAEHLKAFLKKSSDTLAPVVNDCDENSSKKCSLQ